jgi:protein TonB
MQRLVVISAIVHVVVLIIVPLLPGLSRQYDVGLETYSVELVDLPGEAAPPTVEEPEPEPEVVEQEVIEAEPEEVEEEIPEEPPKRPKRAPVEPPPERQRATLADRIAGRMKEQETSRPEEEKPRTEPDRPARPPASSATVSASRFPYAWYLSVIQGKVTSNWSQPSARLIAEDALTAVVSFRIRRDGSVEGITVKRSSGRTTVDQSAAKAVRAAAPFPPLPDDYLENRLDVTIDFTITRESGGG